MVPEKEVVEHRPGLLILYSDGSFERPSDLDVPACADFDTSPNGVATRDVIIDGAEAGIWARIFLPRAALTLGRRSLPVVLHFHGGGFCIGSPSSAHIHRTCSRMANKSSCIWISLYYRLAPEHPLPAAYDDAFSALLWLRTQASLVMVEEREPTVNCLNDDGASKMKADPWLSEYADFSSCFLSGDSAGGTIVHFLAARASGENLSPLHMKGMLLVHPAFPQEAPRSSMELSNVKVSFFHTSALPPGAPFGHPLMNPLHPESPIDLAQLTLPPALVAAASNDPLLPGDVAYFQALRRAGHEAQFFESQGMGHCFHTCYDESSPAFAGSINALERVMVSFIERNRIMQGDTPGRPRAEARRSTELRTEILKQGVIRNPIQVQPCEQVS
ncbi:hypothetical protein KP509_36G031700 [Ceratopteris richardii]|uniref:Alpha/beta hydrolase fold-3 domain-containing protein n=1 Tax=Ceratopteris richardii TaxID=49495 RepID=A0A8T2QBQ3_CERRI|nr:hypothetical protein KP509_36G031700 [Ceratopteris richardii]